MKAVDITGQKFGKLTAIRLLRRNPNAIWLCVCDCGNESDVLLHQLRNGRTQSCGCLRSKGAVTHGLTHTVEYRTWKAIKQRCYDKNSFGYQWYGACGIGLADEWVNDPVAFCAYLHDKLGPRPPEHSIDRIDNDKGYVPGNLRWATRNDQVNNQRKDQKPRSGRPRKEDTNVRSNV